MSVLCKLSFRSEQFKTTFLPSFYVDIIEEYKFETTCHCCGKHQILAHKKWDFEKNELVNLLPAGGGL